MPLVATLLLRRQVVTLPGCRRGTARGGTGGAVVEIRAEELVIKTRDGAISIGDASGAILRVRLPQVAEQDSGEARRQLLELARIAQESADQVTP